MSFMIIVVNSNWKIHNVTCFTRQVVDLALIMWTYGGHSSAYFCVTDDCLQCCSAMYICGWCTKISISFSSSPLHLSSFLILIDFLCAGVYPVYLYSCVFVSIWCYRVRQWFLQLRGLIFHLACHVVQSFVQMKLSVTLRSIYQSW